MTSRATSRERASGAEPGLAIVIYKMNHSMPHNMNTIRVFTDLDLSGVMEHIYGTVPCPIVYLGSEVQGNDDLKKEGNMFDHVHFKTCFCNLQQFNIKPTFLKGEFRSKPKKSTMEVCLLFEQEG